ncbi:hypothetical protein JFT91_20240 [Pseudomonas sp. TH08]|uniref:dermonecrotic toxin domain-containing protein n=1 Tax=unclassified Pseudomonas TaxID=196821 RepID=UPI00191460E6|nr:MULTISPECIES: DUF6543 domain-containing protein [unclassified Pseudomonas]MBK5529785.1 hypothetical protein [Pseudomonas sp. TH06]MBK5534886.1 hypothetical protein [Pseudomonas sp. TH08]
MTDSAQDAPFTSAAKLPGELQAAVDIALPQTPAQFGGALIIKKWGTAIDPHSALLVTLDYNYRGHPARKGIHQGRVKNSQTLINALLGNYQATGDGRIGETAFGLYQPPDLGPTVRIVDNVDEFATTGSGNHDTYEGIYRATVPQTYGPGTQIQLRPAEFKKWVWDLMLADLYQTYLDQSWPSDSVIGAAAPYPLRTSVKAAFVMAAHLQHREGSLSVQGLALALQAAALPALQTWKSLTLIQLQAPTRIPPGFEASRLKLYRYTATDIWCFRQRSASILLLYIPGNSSPLHEFADEHALQEWIVTQGKADSTKKALSEHFQKDDREDGTFHAGVLTALEGMAIYPAMHRLTKEAGFFNNDGYWDPRDYIDFERMLAGVDPFAQLVAAMKQVAGDSVSSIRDDGQVNRDSLSAVVEPVVQWLNRFAPLALFFPGGEGILALAGLIDAAYGLDQAIDGETASERADGVSRTVFGLLNALPLAGALGSLKNESREATLVTRLEDEPTVAPSEKLPAVDTPAVPVEPQSRLSLLRGIGPTVENFSDEILLQIGKVSAVDDDVLRMIRSGRQPDPMLADIISRFQIDQDVTQALHSMQFDAKTLPKDSAVQEALQARRAAWFDDRYQALQRSEDAWVRLFQQQYPGLPKNAVEQMLDRYGIDLADTLDTARARVLFKNLDSKARQYQEHVRLVRAHESLYLQSVSHADSDTLVLHSLKNLPGWPQDLRLEIRDGSALGRVLDRTGALDAATCRHLIKIGTRYQSVDAAPGTVGHADIFEAIAQVLTPDERSALQLPALNVADELKFKLRDLALSRSALAAGLGRMDMGLPFEMQGLRGGGFPDTAQSAALTHAMMRLQVRDVYPGFSDAEVDAWLLQAGANAQLRLDQLKEQLQVLVMDLNGWIEQSLTDVDDMDIEFMDADDEDAAGMTPGQIEAYNVNLLQHTLAYERECRRELAEELLEIWQKRPSAENRLHVDGALTGYKLNLEFEDFHRLPQVSTRFNEVIELSLRGFHVVERESLNGFLESFPHLRTLNLESVDLRVADAMGVLHSALPSVIPSLVQLTKLDLRATHLVLRENTAAQLGSLTNLQVLDLSENPLGVPPMLQGMNNLREVNLRNTGISTCPVGIRDEPYLTSLDLRGNQIARVPRAVLAQAVAPGRVQLWGNPLTDEDTLLRLGAHRRRCGFNVWLGAPGPLHGEAGVWLRNTEQQLSNARLAIWQRLAAKPVGRRFLRTLDGVSLTPEFRVIYSELQARVWRLLSEADASPDLWRRLSQNVEAAADDADNPMALFQVLENRAKLFRDWAAMGRPFPVTGE